MIQNVESIMISLWNFKNNTSAIWWTYWSNVSL